MKRAQPRRPGLLAADADGYVLVQFGLLIFALLAIAALTVDVGLARAARLAMQNAADAAALEALSGRDVWLGDPLLGGAADAELSRRFSASRRAAEVFAEDLDPSAANQRIALGAGGVLEALDLDGSAIPGAGGIDLDSLGVYVPGSAGLALELNAANAPFGDLVAGSFAPATSVLKEGADYSRVDFAAAEPSLASAASAFLARLRRTRNAAGLDRVPGISSSGPTSPLIFGRGAAIGPAPLGDYDPRRDGISVRATALATARPAVRLGDDPAGWGAFLALLATGPGGEPLTLGLAFDAAAFEALAVGGPVPVELFAEGSSGNLTLGGVAVGRLVLLLAAAPRTAVVGELKPVPPLPLVFGASPPASARVAYLRLETDLPGGERPVVAFAASQLIAAASSDGGLQLTLVPRPAAIAPAGGAAHPAALGLAALPQADAERVLAAARLGSNLPAALRVHTLAR